jgi:hypothetical protein
MLQKKHQDSEQNKHRNNGAEQSEKKSHCSGCPKPLSSRVDIVKENRKRGQKNAAAPSNKVILNGKGGGAPAT